MSLPPSFSGLPVEEQCHYYRNVCLEFEKAIKANKDIAVLQQEMERFLNASREVQWPHHTDGVYHKDVIEKAVQKVVTEFQRFIHTKETEPKKAQHEDLLNALQLLKGQIDQLKVR